MKKHTKLLLALFITIGLVFTACAFDSGTETQTSTLVQTDTSAKIETADDYATCLLSAIESGNATEIAALFSSSVQSTDLRASAEGMLGYMQGDVVSWDYKLGMTSASNHGGELKETDVTVDVKMDAIAYRLAIRIRLIDENNPENIGITSLYITEAANTDTNFAYWGGYVWEPGIHIE